jgi:hypothetical protein
MPCSRDVLSDLQHAARAMRVHTHTALDFASLSLLRHYLWHTPRCASTACGQHQHLHPASHPPSHPQTHCPPDTFQSPILTSPTPLSLPPPCSLERTKTKAERKEEALKAQLAQAREAKERAKREISGGGSSGAAVEPARPPPAPRQVTADEYFASLKASKASSAAAAAAPASAAAAANAWGKSTSAAAALRPAAAASSSAAGSLLRSCPAPSAAGLLNSLRYFPPPPSSVSSEGTSAANEASGSTKLVGAEYVEPEPALTKAQKKNLKRAEKKKKSTALESISIATSDSAAEQAIDAQQLAAAEAAQHSVLYDLCLQAVLAHKMVSLVDQLQSLSFPEWQCAAAVQRFGERLEAAIAWIVEGELQGPEYWQAPVTQSPEVDISAEVSQLEELPASLGCEPEVLYQAVADSSGNVEAAVFLAMQRMAGEDSTGGAGGYGGILATASEDLGLQASLDQGMLQQQGSGSGFQGMYGSGSYDGGSSSFLGASAADDMPVPGMVDDMPVPLPAEADDMPVPGVDMHQQHAFGGWSGQTEQQQQQSMYGDAFGGQYGSLQGALGQLSMDESAQANLQPWASAGNAGWHDGALSQQASLDASGLYGSASTGAAPDANGSSYVSNLDHYNRLLALDEASAQGPVSKADVYGTAASNVYGGYGNAYAPGGFDASQQGQSRLFDGTYGARDMQPVAQQYQGQGYGHGVEQVHTAAADDGDDIDSILADLCR